MEVASDFRRFYTLTVPDCTRQVPPDTLFQLAQGLIRVDGSLLRETLLATTPPKGGGEKSKGLSWHGWDEKTMLLLNLNNMVSVALGGKTISPPEQPTPHAPKRDRDKSGGMSAQGFVDMVRNVFKGNAVKG